MSEAAFDSYAAAKDLCSVGFNEPQAETLLHTIRRGGVVDLSTLATREDLQSVGADVRVLQAELEQKATKADFAGLRGHLADMKAEILKWVIGAIGFQTFVVLAAVIALFKLH